MYIIPIMSVTDLTSIRASAVPAVPRTISASQRLAALTKAQELEDIAEYITGADIATVFRVAMHDAAKLLRELAGDAKGDK